jgi:hypothetical protein
MTQGGDLEKKLREEFGDEINYINKEGRVWVIGLTNGKVVFLSENVSSKEAREKVRKATHQKRDATRRNIPS